MKIILCSINDSIRERWRSILQGQQFSLYQVSSLQMLQSVVHKDEQYLFLVHQPFMDLQTISTVCRKSAFYKVFILSDVPRKEDGLVFLQRGVVGYANTYISGPRLIEAVKTIQADRVWFNQEIINKLVQSFSANRQPEEKEINSILNVLSEREKEIALLVSEGMSNSAIAEELYISERTVKSHLTAIFSKTGAQSRLQLALMLRGYKS